MSACSRRALLMGLSAAALLAPHSHLAAQTAPAAPAAPATTLAPLPVVATFSILADFVKQVGADRVAVTSLVGPGQDAHVYSPTPADARALAAARVIFINGLGFEGWVNRLIRSSGTKAPVITATRTIRPLKAEEAGHGHGHSHGHSHGEHDPHAWQSVANVKVYVANIAAALAAADPAGKDIFEENAKRYTAELDALDADIKAGIARIPANRRKIISAHEAFQYFERAYGVDFVAPRGVTTAAEPSPQAVARLIRQIREQSIPAVFLENVTDQRIMQRIAQESGARIGGTLYSDALTPAGGAAPTYIALMRHNLAQIVGALGVTS